jgi:hypothetical protein
MKMKESKNMIKIHNESISESFFSKNKTKQNNKDPYDLLPP